MGRLDPVPTAWGIDPISLSGADPRSELARWALQPIQGPFDGADGRVRSFPRSARRSSPAARRSAFAAAGPDAVAPARARTQAETT